MERIRDLRYQRLRRSVVCKPIDDTVVPAATAVLARVLTLALGLFSIGAPLAGQEARDTLRLSLFESRERALRANPDLAAIRLDRAIAQGRLRQARLFPFNPTAGVLLRGSGGGIDPTVTQEIEVFGQRGLRVAGAEAGIERAQAGIVDESRLLLGEVDRAFYRLVAAAARSKLAAEVLALNTRLADVTARQLEAGQISRLDQNLATVELGRSRARALAAKREQDRVAIELRRLAALPSSITIVPVLDNSQHPPADTTHSVHVPGTSLADGAQRLNVDSLIAIAMARRPDLQASAADIRQSVAGAALARRSALPNLVVSGTSESGLVGGRTFRPGFGVALPIFNRNQGEIESRRAAVRQAGLLQVALSALIRSQVETALTAYRTATAEAEELERTVVARARENRRLVETAYREGKFGLPVLLLIRNQAIDAELEYVAAWLSEREARVALDETTGELVQMIDTADPPSERTRSP